MEATIQALRSVRAEALDLGVRIAVENHSGDMQAREVKMLIEEAGKDFVGSCLDSGNPMWVVEDPLVTLETLAPYVVTTHIRDSAVFEHPRGAAAQWVALGDGSVNFQRFVELYRKLCPQASMQLEIITGRPPHGAAVSRSRISGRCFRRRRRGSSRASWRWPRAGIRTWGRW